MDKKIFQKSPHDSPDFCVPESWRAILDLNDLFKRAQEAMKNPNTGFSGEASNIISDLKATKVKLEGFGQKATQEREKTDIELGIIAIDGYVKMLEAHISRETIRAQAQLTSSQIKKNSQQ